MHIACHTNRNDKADLVRVLQDWFGGCQDQMELSGEDENSVVELWLKWELAVKVNSNENHMKLRDPTQYTQNHAQPPEQTRNDANEKKNNLNENKLIDSLVSSQRSRV